MSSIRKSIGSSLLAIALLSPACAADLPKASAEAVGMSSERLARITATLKADVDANRIPGAVLLVARHGKTRRSSALEARRRLDTVGANVIGYVLNAVPARETSGYYTDYRYAQEVARPSAAGNPRPPRAGAAR